MTSSLVGSEMCIRDSSRAAIAQVWPAVAVRSKIPLQSAGVLVGCPKVRGCLLYTSTLPTICSV
eukprot:11260282-Prorocentrum_lima.AAC.1